jgi:hypothetical protein
MTLAFLLAASLLSVSSAPAQERLVGLLTLPEVFGDGPCHEFTPEEVPLYREVGSEQAFGVIRVDRSWTFPDEGGCDGLIVSVHTGEGRWVSPLPTEELDYEAPAAVVLEERNRWFKLRLSDGVGWVQASEKCSYVPLEELLFHRLTYITEGSDAYLLSRPGGANGVAKASSGDSVHVVEVATVENQLWIHVQVMSHSVCSSADEPTVVSQGWMQAHGATGKPAVWFSSRGC